MLGQVPVHGFIARQGKPDTRGDQAVRFFGGVLADNRESDLTELDVLQAFAAGDQFAVGREDRGDPDDVAGRDSCVAQGKLKTRKPFTMFTDAFGKKYFLSDERHCAGLPCLRVWVEGEKFSCCGKVTRRYCSVNAFHSLGAVRWRQM